MARRTISNSYKAMALRRLGAGENIREVASELDIHETTLRRWLNATDKDNKRHKRQVGIDEPAPSGTEKTKLDLILTAERLFVEQGIDAVSLRQIVREAGQRNETALQYHFNGRNGLLKALLEYRMKPVNERRLALLTALEETANGAPLNLRDIAEALVNPVVEHIWQSSEQSFFSELLHQIQVHRKYLPFVMHADSYEGSRRVAQAYWLAQQEVPAPIAMERFNYGQAVMLFIAAEIERDRWDRPHSGLAQSLWRASSVVEAIVTLWQAPVPTSLTHALHGVDTTNMIARWKSLHEIKTTKAESRSLNASMTDQHATNQGS